METNRKYKDGMFTNLFRSKEKMLELYNALFQSNEQDESKVQDVTLEGVLFSLQKNDLAFLMEDRFIILIEHQSTISDNLPLRLLIYLAREYERIVENKALYRKKRVTIPTPELFVFYNGLEEYPEETTLRLSDSFRVSVLKGSLELEVKVININYKKGSRFLERSKTLSDYSHFIHTVRQSIAEGVDRDAAIKKAVHYCIQNEILKEYLEAAGSEVFNMLYTEFNLEDALKVQREEVFEEAFEEGMEKGMEKGMLQVAFNLLDILDDVTIANKTNLTVEQVTDLRKQANLIV